MKDWVVDSFYGTKIYSLDTGSNLLGLEVEDSKDRKAYLELDAEDVKSLRDFLSSWLGSHK